MFNRGAGRSPFRGRTLPRPCVSPPCQSLSRHRSTRVGAKFRTLPYRSRRIQPITLKTDPSMKKPCISTLRRDPGRLVQFHAPARHSHFRHKSPSPKNGCSTKSRAAGPLELIGCTYGGPGSEFKFNGFDDPGEYPIRGGTLHQMVVREYARGFYDDVYMDLTFVEGFDRLASTPTSCGTPTRPHATTSSTASARLSRGTGSTTPHADDLDFQIEADSRGSCPAYPTRPQVLRPRRTHHELRRRLGTAEFTWQRCIRFRSSRTTSGSSSRKP